MDVRLPDGTVIQNVPDGTTKADLVAKLKSNGMAVPSEWLDARQKTSTIAAIGAGAGLGFGNAVLGAQQLIGKTLSTLGAKDAGGWLERDAQEGRARMAEQARPYKEDSPFVTGASEFVGGAVPTVPLLGGIGKAVTAVGSRAAPAAAATVGKAIGTGGAAGGLGLGARLGGGATAGAVTGAIMDPDAPATGATLGAALGSVAGAASPLIAKGASKAADAVKRGGQTLASLGKGVTPAQTIEVNVTRALERAGIDLSKLSEDVQKAVREDVKAALKVGDDLTPEHMQRLADFRAVGATPTRGTVTLAPILVTQEKNLAKAGANSSLESSHRLANVEAANNRVFVNHLDLMGAKTGSDAAMEQGVRGVAGLENWMAGKKAGVDELYRAARGSDGRSMPLDGAAFTRRASELLDENLLGYALPPDVSTRLNRIAIGQERFDVDYMEQFKSQLARAQRGTSDGATRMALGVVRQALDDVTPAGVPGIPNPGGLPAIPGAAPQAENEAVAAFGRARAANREWMQQVEKTPALKALRDGELAPDDFIKRYVTSPAAKVQDVSEMVKVMDAGGKQALKDGVLGELRRAAIGTAGSDMAKFSAAKFRSALDDLGDKKLKLLFSPEEIDKLKTLSRVAGYTTFQPVGSAVNNPASGALIAGKAIDALNWLGRVPGMGTLSSLGSDALKVTVRTSQQGRAMDAAGAVATPRAASETGGKTLRWLLTGAGGMAGGPPQQPPGR